MICKGFLKYVLLLCLVKGISCCSTIGHVKSLKAGYRPLMDMGANVTEGPPITDEEMEEAQFHRYNYTFSSIYEAISESGYFEGDIVVESHDKILHLILRKWTEKDDTPFRSTEKLWPQGKIPYVISTEYDSRERMHIAMAFAEFHKKTCIRFIPFAKEQHEDFIYIGKGDGCSSSVGRHGGFQFVSIDTKCVQFGIILHELMHAAGFWHEQSRIDRDNYVKINDRNFKEELGPNFQKYLSVRYRLGLPYDYASIMHYSKDAFSKNGQPTIEPTNSTVNIGQTDGFSELDIKGLNLLYNCYDVEDPGCIDSQDHCKYWVTLGYCVTLHDYMHTNCRKSCNICHEEPCVDKCRYCEAWSRRGDCIAKPEYMSTHCRKSCNFCRG